MGDAFRRWQIMAAVALCYLVLTAVFWGTHVLDRLPSDTVFIELSQDRPWWKGLFYPRFEPALPVGAVPRGLRYDRMIAFRFDPASGSTPLRQFPAGDIPGAVASADYRPEGRILPGPPPNEAVRKLAR